MYQARPTQRARRENKFMEVESNTQKLLEICPEKMSRSKEMAVAVLATTSNYREAARKLGVTDTQIYKWLRDEAFKKRVEEQRSLIVEDSLSKMKVACSLAADTLIELLNDVNPIIRRGAANDILTHVTKLMELKEMELRINELEKRLC
jgi:hypothetical protein